MGECSCMRPSFTLTQPRSWIPQMLSKLNLTPVEMQLDRGQVRSRSLPSHRWRPLCVLFVHLDANVMEACTQELKKAQFTVKSDFVLRACNKTLSRPASHPLKRLIRSESDDTGPSSR